MVESVFEVPGHMCGSGGPTANTMLNNAKHRFAIRRYCLYCCKVYAYQLNDIGRKRNLA